MSEDRPAYDAFISYSHALDGILAPTLQREIERFAKPWYRVRAIRVFRDDANLSAEPGLWTAIEAALANSGWLVLMASPEAAESVWVGREISWWLANRSADRILIVITGGEFVWHQQDQMLDAAASTAVPPALHEALREEPRWVDLRWLREVSQADRSNPRLRECVADIAATIRGAAKDALIGEHIRQHRKAMRLARSAVTALVMLLVVSVIATVVAVAQREEARDQARIATARQLAATAVANLDTQVDLAQLLAVEANRMESTPQTRAALFQSVVASPHLVRNVNIGESVTSLTATESRVVVAGTDGGRLDRLDLSKQTEDRMRVGDAPIADLATTSDGRKTIATDGERTVLWDMAGADRTMSIDVPDVTRVAISPSGRFAAVLSSPGDSSQGDPGITLTLVSGSTGAELAQVRTTSGYRVALPDDDAVVLISAGSWERRPIEDLSTTSGTGWISIPVGAQTPGVSSNGEFFGLVTQGSVEVADTHSQAGVLPYMRTGYLSAHVPIAAQEHFTISNRGDYVAAAGGGTLYVARLRSDPDAEDQETDLISLTGRGHAEALAFVGDGSELVSVAGGVLSLWDIAQPAQLSSAQLELPSSLNVGEIPMIAVTPDGRRVAVTSYSGLDDGKPEFSVGPSIHDLAGRDSQPIPIGDQRAHQLPLWSPDGAKLFLVREGGATDILSERGELRGGWPAGGWSRIVAGQVSPDGTRLVLLDQNGGVQVRDAADGRLLRFVEGIGRGDTGANLYYGKAMISADANTAAFVIDQETPRDGAYLVDIETGVRRQLTKGDAEAVTFGDDEVLVQRNDDALEVWNADGTDKLRTFTSDIGYGRSLAVIPGTGLIARLRGNGSVSVSALESGDVLGSFPLPFPTRSFLSDRFLLTAMTSNARTRQLITGIPGGQLVSWQFSQDAWVRIACDVAGRSLTPAEWQRYAGTEVPDDLACSRS